MDLAEILKKTKAKSERVTTVRKPPSIATEDRPYSKLENEYPGKLINTQNTLKSSSNNFKESKLTTNRQQSGNKLVSNCKQSGNETKENSHQPVNKSDNKIQNRQQSGDQTGNTIDNKVATNRQQSSNKPVTRVVFSELVGLQRNIIILMCHECKNSRSRTTDALTLEYIATYLKSSTNTVKTTIQRLEKKGCLLRIAFKNGRGGWSKYEVPDSVYHDVLRNESANKPETKWQQTDNKVVSEPTTEPATKDSSSGSDLLFINNKTTTQFNDEWNFDITPYTKFGFTNSQLKQLSSLGVISATEVEQSLIEFNYDLTNDKLPTIKTGKINFLMGLLRSGHSYVSEDFRSEQEILISQMANRAENKRKKLLEEQFVVWESSLNEEERKNIENKIPLTLKVMLRVHGINNSEVKNWLFNYYLQRQLVDNRG